MCKCRNQRMWSRAHICVLKVVQYEGHLAAKAQWRGHPKSKP